MIISGIMQIENYHKSVFYFHLYECILIKIEFIFRESDGLLMQSVSRKRGENPVISGLREWQPTLLRYQKR